MPARTKAGPGSGLHWHWGTWAALLHRFSGLALLLFLPLHFLALGLALEGAERLQGFLSWTEQPWLKISECALVGALALHFGLGLRVLALEFLPWRGARAAGAVGALLLSCGAGGAYLAALF